MLRGLWCDRYIRRHLFNGGLLLRDCTALTSGHGYLLTTTALLFFEFGLLLSGGTLLLHVMSDGRARPFVEVFLVIVAIDSPFAFPAFFILTMLVPSGIALLIAGVAVLPVVIIFAGLLSVAIHIHQGKFSFNVL